MTRGPNQARTSWTGSRKYIHPDAENPGPKCAAGDEFVSVTTILGQKAKPALTGWAAKVSATYAVENVESWKNLDKQAAIDLIKGAHRRRTSEAADAGSAAHHMVEEFVKEGILAVDDLKPELRGFGESFAAFVADWKPVYRLCESTVYNHEYGYAGSLDGVVDLPVLGRCLLDVKTGASGPWAEAGLQLAAYAHADEIIDGPPYKRREMLPVDCAVILKLRPEGYELYPADISDDVFEAFVACATLSRFTSELEKEVIGRPLTPPRSA